MHPGAHESKYWSKRKRLSSGEKRLGERRFPVVHTMRCFGVFLALVAGGVVAPSQTIVSFDSSQFVVNGQPFFPVGWYGGERPAALDSLEKSGANVVLSYWNNVIDAYAQGPKRYDISSYRRALRVFLDSAWERRIMVIVNIPRTDASLVRHTLPRLLGNVDSLAGDVSIRNNPALLGWYVYDEPEIEPANLPRITIEQMHAVYVRIKQYDRSHPVFVDLGAPMAGEFNRYYPAGSGVRYRDSLFYDVLMVDHYPFYNDEVSPAERLSYVDTWAPRVARRFWNEREHASPGALMLVAQGAGPNQGDEKLRYPTRLEMVNQLMSAVMKLQNGSRSGLGGVLYFHWEGLYGRNLVRDSVLALMKYFTGNKLNAVLRQVNLNSRCRASAPLLRTLMRLYGGAYYVFALNDTHQALRDVSITVNIGNGAGFTCRELTMPFGRSIAKGMVREGNGSYRIADTFSPRECRVYRIGP
jgi:hypothetical protein